MSSRAALHSSAAVELKAPNFSLSHTLAQTSLSHRRTQVLLSLSPSLYLSLSLSPSLFLSLSLFYYLSPITSLFLCIYLFSIIFSLYISLLKSIYLFRYLSVSISPSFSITLFNKHNRPLIFFPHNRRATTRIQVSSVRCFFPCNNVMYDGSIQHTHTH